MKLFKLRFLVVGVTAAFILTSPLVSAKEKKHNITQMITAAGENVEKADEELKEKEAAIRNEKREAKIREHFEKGNVLYKEGKLKEAKKEWQKVLAISKNPQIKNYIRESVKRAKAEEVARKKEEREKEKRLKAEQREKERRELEGQRRLEAEKRRQKTENRKQGIEQARFEKERQAQIKKQEKKEQKRIEAERKNKEHLLKKERKKLEAEREKTERERLRTERAKQKKEEKEKKGLEKKRQRIRVKGTAKDSEGKLKLSLEDLNYKTEKECLDVLEKKPEDKEAFDNLVKLYRLQNRYIERGKEFHNKGDYQAAIKEFKKALAIEPGNKKVIRWIKKVKRKPR